MVEIALYGTILGSLVLLTWLALKAWPALERAVLGGETNRKHALDGARGILACSVMIHHLLLGHLMELPLKDDGPLRAHPFVNQLGSASVALFFMISAYLFGGRLFASRGRLDLASFAVGRVMRIVPLYLFVVILVACLCLALQGFGLAEPPIALAKEVGCNLLFNFTPICPVNGVAAARDMLGPVWTLRYEWILYAEIPLMALLYQRLRWWIVLYVPLLASVQLFHDGRFYFFVAGLACAQLAAVSSVRLSRLWPLAGAASLAILLALYYQSVSWKQALLLIPTLVAILQGRRWFALLGVRPLRYLGEISFSIYLLHMPVIVAFTALTGTRWRMIGTARMAADSLIIGVLVLMISSMTFLTIEKPLMHVRWRRKMVAREDATGAPAPL